MGERVREGLGIDPEASLSLLSVSEGARTPAAEELFEGSSRAGAKDEGEGWDGVNV